MRLERVVGWSPRPAVFSLLLAAIVVFNGCATPVGVRRMDPAEAHRRLTESVLTSQNLSAPTLQLLNRSDLAEKFKSHPTEVISSLHKGMLTASEPDVIFALAELSFLHATRSGDRSYFLASAVYAYASIFPKNVKDTLDPFDPRLRTAVDLYNQGLAEGFTQKETGKVVLESGTYRLPFGELVVHIDPDEFRWGPYRLNDFFAASAFDVRGLRNNYRWPGVGTALVATLKQVEGEQARDFARVPSSLKISTTAFLQLEDVEEGLRKGRIEGDPCPLHESGNHVGQRRRAYRPPRVPSDGCTGLYFGRLPGLRPGAQGAAFRRSVAFQANRALQGQRDSDGALPSWTYPAGARSRNGFQSGALGADAQ